MNKKAKRKIEIKYLIEYPPINDNKTTEMKIKPAVYKFEGIINEIINKTGNQKGINVDLKLFFLS